MLPQEFDAAGKDLDLESALDHLKSVPEYNPHQRDGRRAQQIRAV